MRWVRSPDDVRCHAVMHREADRVAATGWTQTLCGATLPWLILTSLRSRLLLCWRKLGGEGRVQVPVSSSATWSVNWRTADRRRYGAKWSTS